MQEQYRRLKAECGDALLFFRLGDFFELFGEDAERAAPVLEVALTSREISPGVRWPMCGVPHHALDSYASRLLARGFKVAVADQVEDPAQAKGLVRREIVRVLTPGTLTEPGLLAEFGDSLLVAATASPTLALAWADASTGAVRVPVWEAGEDAERAAWDELCRLRPREVLVARGDVPAVVVRFAEEHGVVRTELGPGEVVAGAAAALWGAEASDPVLDLLVTYLTRTLRVSLRDLPAPTRYRPSAAMAIDWRAARHLELVERQDGSRGPEGTLLGTVDRTLTPMGHRLLRRWLLAPLQDVAAIRARQDAVDELVHQPLFREELRGRLREVADLERLAVRVAREQAGPRELAALGASLRALPGVREALVGCRAALLAECLAALDPMEDVAATLARALVPQPPASVRDGGVIAPGYDEELDALRAAGTEARTWLAELEARERERTGIRSLKVGYHKVLGYYLEVGASHARSVPADWKRRQTLAVAERFVTPELKALEDRIVGAEEKALRREAALFHALRAELAGRAPALRRTAEALATLDALAALADVATRRGWVRPVVDRSRDLVVRAGRHPVVEQALGPGRFVPNDVRLGAGGPSFLLVTGPNMAGKSTFMRQVALIAILAQMGSFVPAAEARIGVVDRIFTRIGASDDLARGQSTFMVEMTEVAELLRQATRQSLLLLDEVGRGTGTRDGLAIAWAVAEDLVGRVRARTLFATHFHELTALAAAHPTAGNVHVAVREEEDRVVFLHRVTPGAADRSYGVAVAALAGVPEAVIARARRILAALEAGASLAEAAGAPAEEVADAPAAPDGARQLLERLAAVDPERLTPLAALDLLAVLQAEASALLGVWSRAAPRPRRLPAADASVGEAGG
jgi:DNA mismatch repair protein MutS